jgi:hypothetical protein
MSSALCARRPAHSFFLPLLLARGKSGSRAIFSALSRTGALPQAKFSATALCWGFAITTDTKSACVLHLVHLR